MLNRCAWLSWGLVVFLALATQSVAVHDVTELTQEVEELSLESLAGRVSALEMRLESLEYLVAERIEVTPGAAVSPDARGPQGGPAIRGTWDLAREGMSFEQVTRILGKPTRTNMLTPDIGTWHYKDVRTTGGQIVSGNVVFVDSRVYRLDVPVW